MTDKKYEELLKCAEDLIKSMEAIFAMVREEALLRDILNSTEYEALKACLPPPPPSREEIADFLERKVLDRYRAADGSGYLADAGKLKYLGYAIAELRKDAREGDT